MELVIRIVLFLCACFAICAVSSAVREETFKMIMKKATRSFILTAAVIFILSVVVAVVHSFV
ncbi:MAG: hypothetical protein N2234_10080 [Planctomycetota bacterium]|nr:hypothetical protein [Planctomycetota bacterium]